MDLAVEKFKDHVKSWPHYDFPIIVSEVVDLTAANDRGLRPGKCSRRIPFFLKIHVRRQNTRHCTGLPTGTMFLSHLYPSMEIMIPQRLMGICDFDMKQASRKNTENSRRGLATLISKLLIVIADICASHLEEIMDIKLSGIKSFKKTFGQTARWAKVLTKDSQLLYTILGMGTAKLLDTVHERETANTQIVAAMEDVRERYEKGACASHSLFPLFGRPQRSGDFNPCRFPYARPWA